MVNYYSFYKLAQESSNKYTEKTSFFIIIFGLSLIFILPIILWGLDRKAEAMKKYGEGAILEMYFKALPEIAKNVAAPLTNVDKITMYGADGTSNLISNITQSIGKINDGVQAKFLIVFENDNSYYVGLNTYNSAVIGQMLPKEFRTEHALEL